MELSEEEKKAIELLKKLQKKTPYIIWGDGTPYNKNNQIQTILNVIDRQQKEIEESKKPKYIINCKTNEITKLSNDFISKDKIREKMREIMGYTFTTSEERYSQDYAYDRLKELLEDD